MNRQIDDGVRRSSRSHDLAWFARQHVRLSFEFEIHRSVELQAALRVHVDKLLRQIAD